MPQKRLALRFPEEISIIPLGGKSFQNGLGHEEDDFTATPFI